MSREASEGCKGGKKAVRAASEGCKGGKWRAARAASGGLQGRQVKGGKYEGYKGVK